MFIPCTNRRRKKRWTAIFYDENNHCTDMIDFASSINTDYLRMHLKDTSYYEEDEERRERLKKNYINSQTIRKYSDFWEEPNNVHSLERFICWNKSTFHDSVKDFKKRFDYN